MTYTTLLFEVKDGLAHITLNRPESLNSINLELSRELMKVMLECDQNKGIRAVLLSGSGRLFCAGGDLKAFTYQGDRLPYYIKEVTAYLHSALSRMIRMEPPTVAVVHGYAAGAGMSLALACDLVIASDTARFMAAYTRVGLTPDGSMSYVLPRLVGLRRALELTLTNRVLSAHEALQWGLITELVPEKDLLPRAIALATELARGHRGALGGAKRLMYRGLSETLETQMENESEMIADIARSLDTHEAIEAFLKKREPRFLGK